MCGIATEIRTAAAEDLVFTLGRYLRHGTLLEQRGKAMVSTWSNRNSMCIVFESSKPLLGIHRLEGTPKKTTLVHKNRSNSRGVRFHKDENLIPATSANWVAHACARRAAMTLDLGTPLPPRAPLLLRRAGGGVG